MLFFFSYICLILSIQKDQIKRALNTTVGLCVVYPDSSFFDISKNNIFQSLMNMIQGRFSFSTYPYSQYSLSDKSTLSRHGTNFIITRDKKFLEHYCGNLSISSIAEEINQAFYSYVEILNESSLQQFKEDTGSLFLLTGPSIIKEYEDAAFFYKNTKARFGFLYQNSTDEKNSSNSFVSLYYIKNKYNVSRLYDMSVPMIQFIRSCKTEKLQKKSFQSAQIPPRYQKHSFQFVAITDNFTEEIQSAFDYINNSNYGTAIDFDVVSWENATELKKMCQIKKPESNLSFVIYPKLRKRQYVDCNVFQDMDFYSKELLYFFVSKSFKGISMDQSSKNSIGSSGSSNIFVMNSSPMSLTQSTFSNFIPGRNLALVFIECPNSFSLFEAKVIFNSLRHEFNELRIMGDTNNRYLKPVDFYKIEYYIDSYKLPSADSFPTFAIFRPYNKLANVFNEILTIENLRNWIIKFASEDEDDESTIPEEKQSNSIINDFNAFIKDLSIGSNGRQINKIDKTQNSPKPTPNSPKPPLNSKQETSTNQNSNSPKTDSNSPVSDSNKEKIKVEIIDDSSSPLKSLLNSFGFNFNFDDIKEIKILNDFDMLGSNEDDNLEEITSGNSMSNEEIEKLVEKVVKKEVKNLFDQEKNQLKNEVISEVLDIIQNKQNSTQRSKIIKVEKEKNEKLESKNEVNQYKKDSSEENNEKEAINKKQESKNEDNQDKKDSSEENYENKIKSENLEPKKEVNQDQKDSTEENYEKKAKNKDNQNQLDTTEKVYEKEVKSEVKKDNIKKDPTQDIKNENDKKEHLEQEVEKDDTEKVLKEEEKSQNGNSEHINIEEKTTIRKKSYDDDSIFQIDEDSEEEL